MAYSRLLRIPQLLSINVCVLQRSTKDNSVRLFGTTTHQIEDRTGNILSTGLITQHQMKSAGYPTTGISGSGSMEWSQSEMDKYSDGWNKLKRVEGSVPDIPDFYRGKSIFITGATGFMGKVLVERLLSTCPDIGKLYLLMRGRKDLNHQKRLDQLKESKVFDILRQKNPHQLDKLVALNGDLTKPELDLTTNDREQLEEVSMVFHVGASVKLVEPLKDSVNNNLLPTMALLELCDTLPKLEVFMYVSTEYSNSDRKRIEEKVYPPPMEPKTLLDMVENQDLDEEQEKKLIGARFGSYTLSKAMAEDVVEKHGCDRFSVAVFRPGIVIASLRHPFPGWIENLNGAAGVIAAVSSGVLRVFGLNRRTRGDMVPVDITIDSLIAAGWEIGVDRPKEVRVYNCTCQENPTNWGFFADAVNDYVIKYPSVHAVLYPYYRTSSNRYLELVLEKIFQTVPIYMIDYYLSKVDKKYNGKLIQTMHKVQDMRDALWYFATVEIDFVNENTKKLRERLSERDKAIFNLDPHTIDWNELMMVFVRGTRRHVMMEPDHTLDRARARVRKMGYFSTAAKGVGILAGLKIFSSIL